MICVPYAVRGWNPTGTKTGDPRVPVICPDCIGARVLAVYEPLGAFGANLIPVRCTRCGGAGKVHTERRRGAR